MFCSFLIRLDTLPVGNGRLGAMVFGGVEKERIGFIRRYLLGQKDQYGTHLPLSNL